MNDRKLTTAEIKEMTEAIKICEEVRQRIENLQFDNALKEISMSDVWDLKNRANEIVAVLYNVHHGVYQNGVRS